MSNKQEQTSQETTPAQTRQLWRAIVLVVLLIFVFSLAFYFLLNPTALGDLDALLAARIEQAGPWGWFLIVAAMVLHSFVPLPAEFVAIAAGMSYPFALAIFLVWFGAMLGAIVAFALARWLGQSFVERMLSPAYLDKLQNWRQGKSVFTLLICRFIPLISFNLINYAAGLSGVPWWPFLWTTAIGILPITILSVFIGATMGTLPISWVLTLSGTGIALILAAHWWYKRRTAQNIPTTKI